jgi:hypothetical protein
VKGIYTYLTYRASTIWMPVAIPSETSRSLSLRHASYPLLLHDWDVELVVPVLDEADKEWSSGSDKPSPTESSTDRPIRIRGTARRPGARPSHCIKGYVPLQFRSAVRSD